MKKLMFLLALLAAMPAGATTIQYLAQSRSVSVTTAQCFFAASSSAPDYGVFDATVSSPGGGFTLECDDRVMAQQYSALGADGINLNSTVYSGTEQYGGGPARSDFTVEFHLDTATWFQFNGERYSATEYGPNVVASENSALLETTGGSAIDLLWDSASCEELLAGNRAPRRWMPWSGSIPATIA